MRTPYPANYQSTANIPRHPQAITALWLARKLYGAPSDTITAELKRSGCPRALYVLAATLQAASGYGSIPPGKIINIKA